MHAPRSERKDIQEGEQKKVTEKVGQKKVPVPIFSRLRWPAAQRLTIRKAHSPPQPPKIAKWMYSIPSDSR